MPTLAPELLVTISLICSICGLAYLKKFEEIPFYRELANKYKTVFDELEMKYRRSDFSNLSEVRGQVSQLRTETSHLSISLIGRRWSKHVIKEEMDLAWIDEE